MSHDNSENLTLLGYIRYFQNDLQIQFLSKSQMIIFNILYYIIVQPPTTPVIVSRCTAVSNSTVHIHASILPQTSSGYTSSGAEFQDGPIDYPFK